MKAPGILAIALAGVMIVTVSTVVVASSNDVLLLQSACQMLLDQPFEKQSLDVVLNTARTATNSEIRCRSMAIFTLSSLLGDDLDGYQRSFTALHSEFPQNPLTIQAAPDNLSGKCAACEGSGKGTLPCSECNGKGACKGCRGSGRVKRFQFDGPDFFAKCAACKGTKRCKHCQGKGKLPSACQACGGRGNVISKSKARAEYVQSVKTTADFCSRLLKTDAESAAKAVEKAREKPKAPKKKPKGSQPKNITL